MTWGVEHLSVRFGDRSALEDVALAIVPGEVHAVIGGDGAGKSTLMRVAAGLNLGQTGTVQLPPPDRIGFVPSTGGIFKDLTVDENLEFVADAYRLRGWRLRAGALCARAGLEHVGGRLAAALSGGEQRKLAATMSMLHEPELLVFDEVTNGVDPVSRMELWRMMTTAMASGTAVVMTTTYLEEAERAATVLILHEGRVLASGSPRDIVAGTRGTVRELAAPTNRATAWRHGSRWRQWEPDGSSAASDAITLEDAAIIRELVATRRAV
jgi:ABC-2 type transport system ATP-binding protein